MLSQLSLRDRIVLERDMTNALRPGELFALKWKCFNHRDCAMRLIEAVYKGQIRAWGKTKKSLGVVHIPKQLSGDFLLLKQESSDPSPEAFIFPNVDGGFVDPDNYRKRTLHRLARDLKLPKLTFQVIRRTIATLAQKKGTVKDIQGLLRHFALPRPPMSTCRKFLQACRPQSRRSAESCDKSQNGESRTR